MRRQRWRLPIATTFVARALGIVRTRSPGCNHHLQVTRSIVRGEETTPKNHQRRRVDLSPQLYLALRDWQTQQSAEWLARGRTRPDWVFPSTAGTPLDESKTRKAFNRVAHKMPVKVRLVKRRHF